MAVGVVPATISTVRKRKGLAFPGPRPILLASLIVGAPNCAALMGFRPAALRASLFSSHFFPSQLLRTEAFAGLPNFHFLAVIDVYSREMMRT